MIYRVKWALRVPIAGKILRSMARCKNPVFVVGCGHSGTSLMQVLLDSHPAFYSIPGESAFAFKPDPGLAILDFGLRAKWHGKRRWIEKTPLHIWKVKLIRSVVSDARFVLMIRDGRDVATSIMRRTGSLEAGAVRWLKDNIEGEKYWKDPDFKIIRYEELVSDFETTMRSVLEFLNESYSASIECHTKTRRTYYSTSTARPENEFGENHNQYRNWQINQPIFDGTKRWNILNEQECLLLRNTIGSKLIEYGYVDDEDWWQTGIRHADYPCDSNG